MGEQSRYFLSYKFNGVPLEQLHKEIDPIKSFFEDDLEEEFFCNLYSESDYQKYTLTPQQIMLHALQELKVANYCLVYVTTSSFGGGSAMEAGYALAQGIPLIALIKNDVTESITSLIAMSSKVIRFTDQKDLLNHLSYHLDK